MPPAPVSIARVETADLPVSFEYVGQTTGSRDVEVRARVAGILMKRNYREGAAVKGGQSMYQLDTAPLRAALDRAEADVAGAQARVDQAGRTLKRLEPLYKARAVSQREFDDAASAEAIARADVKSLRVRIAEARLNLGYARVEAPIGGVAGRSQVSEGALVRGPETLLTTITQTDPMHILFGIAQADQLRWRQDVQAGRLVLPKNDAFEVEVTLGDGSKLARKGRLQFTEARVSSTTGMVEAQAEIDNADGALAPGQFVRVRLVGAVRPNAVRVPTRAVLEGPQGKFVYLLADGKAQPKPVQVGEQLGDQWIVTSGLQKGDPVIVDGVMKIGPGAAVQAAPPASSPVQGGPPPGAASAPASPASK